MIEGHNTFSEEEQQQILYYLYNRGQILNKIEVFDNLWDELMQQPFQTGWLRSLRINLRCLRSAVILLEPLLPAQGQIWLKFLKDTAAELGNIREYDVAIKGCAKYENIMQTEPIAFNNFVSGVGINLPTQLEGLKEVLQHKRDEQCQVWLEHAKAGWISDGLADFKEMLTHEYQISSESKVNAKTFLNERLKVWGVKLCEKLENVSAESSMSEIHKLRIKIKRYRYSYDTYMLFYVNVELLECLKEMQDMLGYVHDRDSNIAIMEKLVLASNDAALRQEYLCYKAWSEKEIKEKLAGFTNLRLKLIEQIKCNLDKPYCT